jgi:fructokinase
MRLGVDLGGTKIEICALDDRDSIVERRRVATPAGDYDGILAAIADLVASLEADVGTSPLGIGIPGTISPATGLAKNANSTVLIGRPFESDLRAHLGRDLRLDNDANCFTRSEASGGAADGAASVFGVIVGTGTGGGIGVAGSVLHGPNGIAGEWGHNPLPWARDDEQPGPQCYCGKRGCIETWLAGPSFARQYAALTGETLAPPEIAARAAAGETAARALLEGYADRFARCLATVINILDPEAIVLGGGMSNIDYLYHAVPPLLERYVFSDRVVTPIRRARFGDSSGVRGAAMLWPPG